MDKIFVVAFTVPFSVTLLDEQPVSNNKISKHNIISLLFMYRPLLLVIIFHFIINLLISLVRLKRMKLKKASPLRNAS